MSDYPDAATRAHTRTIIDARYNATLSALIRGDHREHIATLVFGYIDNEEQPTAGDVADDILEYVAHIYADTAPARHPLTPPDLSRCADLMAEATSYFIGVQYAIEAIAALEEAGWTITPPR